MEFLPVPKSLLFIVKYGIWSVVTFYSQLCKKYRPWFSLRIKLSCSDAMMCILLFLLDLSFPRQFSETLSAIRDILFGGEKEREKC